MGIADHNRITLKMNIKFKQNLTSFSFKKSPTFSKIGAFRLVVSNCEFVTFPLVSWVRCGS